MKEIPTCGMSAERKAIQSKKKKLTEELDCLEKQERTLADQERENLTHLKETSFLEYLKIHSRHLEKAYVHFSSTFNVINIGGDVPYGFEGACDLDATQSLVKYHEGIIRITSSYYSASKASYLSAECRPSDFAAAYQILISLGIVDSKTQFDTESLDGTIESETRLLSEHIVRAQEHINLLIKARGIIA